MGCDTYWLVEEEDGVATNDGQFVDQWLHHHPHRAVELQHSGQCQHVSTCVNMCQHVTSTRSGDI